MSILVEISARHVHVTEETLHILFGDDHELTLKKELSQPGQFASNERVDVVGPKRTLSNVSILGPCRKADQVEISATDARSIGIAAPIRETVISRELPDASLSDLVEKLKSRMG